MWFSRGFPRQKYGTADYIDLKGLDALLNDTENWMYDNDDANLADTLVKFDTLQTAVKGPLCEKYVNMWIMCGLCMGHV